MACGLEITHKFDGRKVSMAEDFARVFVGVVVEDWDAAHDDITRGSKLD